MFCHKSVVVASYNLQELGTIAFLTTRGVKISLRHFHILPDSKHLYVLFGNSFSVGSIVESLCYSECSGLCCEPIKYPKVAALYFITGIFSDGKI